MILSVMHPIKRYCDRRGIRQRAFAQLVGLSEGYVSQLISGRERCGKHAALKIVQKTGGAVTLEDLLTWEPSEPTQAAS